MDFPKTSVAAGRPGAPRPAIAVVLLLASFGCTSSRQAQDAGLADGPEEGGERASAAEDTGPPQLRGDGRPSDALEEELDIDEDFVSYAPQQGEDFGTPTAFDSLDDGISPYIGEVPPSPNRPEDRTIDHVRVRGDYMLRFGADLSHDMFPSESLVDYVSLDHVEQVPGDGVLDFSTTPASGAHQYSWNERVWTHGRYAYLAHIGRPLDLDAGPEADLTFVVVDLEAAGGPAVIGSFFRESAGELAWGGPEILLTDNALLVGGLVGRATFDTQAQKWQEREYAYDIYDLGDGEKPKFATRFTVPSRLALGGWGQTNMGCASGDGWGGWHEAFWAGPPLVSGDIVASQHLEPVDDGSGRVRFYLDRLDVSDPAKPRWLEEVNIPGHAVLYDHASGRVVSMDLDPVTRGVASEQECHDLGYRQIHVPEPTQCTIYRRRVHSLVVEDARARRLDMRDIETDYPAFNVAISSESLFFFRLEGNLGMLEDAHVAAHVLTLQQDGEFRALAPAEVEGPAGGPGGVGFRAVGSRGFIQIGYELRVLDARGDEAVFSGHEIPGGTCVALEVTGDHAYCALGENGLLDIEL